MHTQNESGKDAGRYLYRTHEVGRHTSAPTAPVRRAARRSRSPT